MTTETDEGGQVDDDGVNDETAGQAADEGTGEAGDGGGKDEDAAESGDSEAGEHQPYRPDSLPEHLRGDSDQDTIDKLLKAYTPLREAQAKGKPKGLEDYGKVEFSDEFKASHGDLEERDGDVMKLVRETALETEMPTDVFASFVPKLLEKAVEANLIEKPIDANAEREKAGGDDAYSRRLTALDARFDGLKEQGVLSDAEVAEAKLLYVTADGMSVVEKLLARGSERGVETGGGRDAGGDLATMADVVSAMDDDRYDKDSPKFDASFVKRVRARHAELSKARGG